MPAFGQQSSPGAALADLERVVPWSVLHRRARARRGDSARPPLAGPTSRVRYVLSERELRALLTAAARPDQLGDALIDRLAGVAGMRVRQAEVAAVLYERGSRARAVLEPLLAATDDAAVRPLRIRVARDVVANGGLAVGGPELIDAIHAIPNEVQPAQIEAALRRCSSSFDAGRLLRGIGDRGVTAARSCIDDASLSPGVRAACIAAVGAPAREHAARLLESDPSQFGYTPELRDMLGEDTVARHAHAVAANRKLAMDRRVEAARLLPIDETRPVMEMLLGDAVDAHERAAVLGAALSPVGSVIAPALVHEAVRAGGLPSMLVLALIEAYPGAASDLARPLWDDAELDGYQAACVLDCLWPDAPGLARAQVREAVSAYGDPSRAARLAASIALLGPADYETLVLGRVLLIDPAAPLHLRVLAARVLGAAGADLAPEVLSDPATPDALVDAINRALRRAGTWPWERHAALRGLPW